MSVVLARLLLQLFCITSTAPTLRTAPFGNFKQLSNPPVCRRGRRPKKKWGVRTSDTLKLIEANLFLRAASFEPPQHLEPGLLSICTPPTFDWLAGRRQPDLGMPAKQVIQDSHLDVKVSVLSLEPPPDKNLRDSPLDSRREPVVDVQSLRVVYLQRVQRALFFPLWERRRNFQTPSSEESTQPEMCSGSRKPDRRAFPLLLTYVQPKIVLHRGELRLAEPSIY